MGFWGSVKGTFKKAWRAVKAAVRVVVRVVITIVNALTVGLFDLLLGFLAWPPKKLRLHVFILSDEKGPLVNPGDLTPSIDFARTTLKDRFNVKLVAYGKQMVETITAPAPRQALEVQCDSGSLREEFEDAGEFFADHIAGWNAIPISLTFPITAFVVRDVKSKLGCSLGPLTEYLVIDPEGVKSVNTLVHEIGHACSLWHSGSKSNLMWPNDDRGNGAKWFQKNLLRSSRHVQYW
jgi:hypothetical protein